MPQAKKSRSSRREKKVTTRVPPLAFRPISNMKINLVFRQEVALTESAAGVGASKWYRMTGAFDPDQTAGGPSALGFAQYAALFSSYRVHAFRFHAEGIVGATNPGNASMAVVTITPNPRTQVLPADPALWGGEPGALSKIVAPQLVGGRNTFVIDKTYLPWNVLKVTKAQYMNESDYSSLATTTPVKEPYLAFSVNGVLTAAGMTLTAIVTISYEVEFFEPQVLV